MNKVMLVFLSLLISCAHYSEKECSSFDWEQEGYMAAINGDDQHMSLGHFERQCFDKYGIQVDENDFGQGFMSGLKAFCTPESAYHFGLSGRTYLSTCPENQKEAFNKAYQKGRNVFNENELARLKQENKDLKYRLSMVETENTEGIYESNNESIDTSTKIGSILNLIHAILEISDAVSK